MEKSPFQHLLFDLGGTLMHARGDWEPVLLHGDQALAAKLLEHAIELDSRVFRARLHEYYMQRDTNHRETTYHFVLSELLNELGYDQIAERVIRLALDALYEVTRENWKLEQECQPALEELKMKGYHMGILSNAGDDQDVQELVRNFGIREYFDFVLTSAACFYRKPHARSFEIALAHWSVSPQDTIMIGDSLEADILGAGSLGLKTIWITRRAQFTDAEMHHIKPDYSIRNLSELAPTLDRITFSRA